MPLSFVFRTPTLALVGSWPTGTPIRLFFAQLVGECRVAHGTGHLETPRTHRTGVAAGSMAKKELEKGLVRQSTRDQLLS